MEPSISTIGMAWYRAEDYDAIRRVMADGYNFPMDFAQWLKKAEARERRFRRDGYAVARVFIDPDLFREWCRPRGLKRDHLARIMFASRLGHNQGLTAE